MNDHDHVHFESRGRGGGDKEDLFEFGLLEEKEEEEEEEEEEEDQKALFGVDNIVGVIARPKRPSAGSLASSLSPRKRRKKSACHRWTNEARAAEIVSQFARDRTSAIFYLFRRIATGGMNKNLRIVPAKRNPPKYSCYFEELGMIADPDNDSHYHVWAWPAPDSPASRFMSTYVGATELEGFELGGPTSDEDGEGAASGAGTKVLPPFLCVPSPYIPVDNDPKGENKGKKKEERKEC